MSYDDYENGMAIEMEYDSDDFYGVIQGAMRLADTDNLEKLKSAFPEQWKDLQARYHAARGKLQGET